jgi:5-(carboxyamino)imidazole ribonucleotide mutase
VAGKPPHPGQHRLIMDALPLVGIIMGSQSDWPTLRHAAETLARLAIPHETRIVSAHRTPDRLRDYADAARGRGLRVIIAGAGGAAHLPGMCAAWTALPVLGVPVESHSLKGLDSLLSIVQMPAGVPVGTMAIGRAGAINAALLAAAILAIGDPALAVRLDDLRAAQTLAVPVEPHDTGPHDAGSSDAGPPNKGPRDTGQIELGQDDTGPHDTGPHDTGPHDTGPHTTKLQNPA